VPRVLTAIRNATKHVGAGRNVGLYTLARNALPARLCPGGFAFTPLTVFLSINSACNLRCKMCDIGQRNIESSFYRNLKTDSADAELSYERAAALIEEIRRFSPPPRVSVTTTEPFLYKRLFDVAAAATRNGLEFQVTTNGSLLDRHLDDVFASGIDELAISVDGPGAVHDEIRGMQGLYDRIKGSLESIRQRKERTGATRPRITIATTVSNFNYARLVELLDDLDEAAYQRVIISHMNFIDQAMVDQHNAQFPFVGKAEMAGLPGETDNYRVDVAVLHDQLQRIRATYPKAQFAPDYGLKDLDTFYNRPTEFVWPGRCYVPWFVVEVLANGDVIPLTRCIHIKMGNIYESSLREVWNGAKYREFRAHLMRHKRFPICRRCRGIL